jgi:hypothetical protein
VDFDDFSFYRRNVVDIYYVGGFGVMGWVDPAEYGRAKPDPLSDTAAEIVQHMNTDHSDALVILTRVFAGIEAQEVEMTSVDRLGSTCARKLKMVCAARTLRSREKSEIQRRPKR